MEKVSDEARTLRSAMLDLVALSALPAVWAGYQPRQVAEGLADVLLSTVGLDLVYLRLPGQTEGQEIEVARTAGRPATPDETRDMARALAPWLDGGSTDAAPSIPNPAGSGTARLVVVPIGYDRQGGVLVAGSQQTGFPSEEDRLLLSVGANQAAAVLQRQRAEAALRESDEELRLANARLELAVRGSNISIWEIDMPDGDYRHGRRYYVNIWEQLGYEHPDSPINHETSMTLVHPDDRALLEEAMRRYLAGQTSEFEVENRVRHKDGSYRWILSRGVAVRDAGGKPIRFVGSAVDITDRKRAEEALRVSRERLDLVVQSTELGLWYCDLPFDKLAWNAKCKEHFGVPPDADVTIGLFYERLHPEDRERTRQAVESAIGQHSTYDVKYRTVAPDGGVRWIRAIGRAFYDRAGEPIRFDGVQVDDTRQKQAEEELRQAKEAAEAANRAKDEFLANVSHEIRTPMNAILGMTDLALDTPLSDDQRQCLRTVKSAADNLLGIINDLLDFSKIEAGKMELDPADFCLRAAVGDVLRALATRAHKKGLELVYHVQKEVPDALVGDAARLRQVLLNLVGNAIKFTEEGEVVVTVKSEIRNPKSETSTKSEVPSPQTSESAVSDLDHSDLGFVSDFEFRASDLQDVLIRFEVKDTGIGIPPDKQEKVFRAFEQEDTSTTRKYGGTGLGLSIAARLVALMGGTITVQSEPGRGSTFTFTARFGRQPQPTENTPALPPVLLRDLRVLVVDDNATNRHILEEWLRGWRMDPAAVGDGVAAMGALWDAASVGRPYPLVLLDARMPDTDGLTLAAQIRERAALSAIRIILLTSGDRPGDLARSRELRIDAHLLKPVQQDELLETIYRVMSRASGDAPTAVEEPGRDSAATPVPAAAPLHILVAEDNEYNAQLMEQLLARRGHRLRLTTNGREALALAGEGVFDLLLLDVHMPEMDGFEVVQAIRERERTVGGHLPVIALTARSRKEDRERCLAAGMDDFQTKPIRPAELLAAIDRLAPAPGLSRPVQSAAEEPASLLDRIAVLRACGDDEETLREMCRAFQTYLPDRLAEVGAALRTRDAPRLREAAHKLCALLFEFSTAAGDMASDLEDHAAGGRLDEARPLVEQLEVMARELLGLASALSLETLRQQARPADDPDRTARP